MQPVEQTDVVKVFPESVAPTKVRAVKCNHCGTTVYSRCKTDKRTCLCGRVSLSGGVTPGEMTCSLPMDIEWFDIVIDKDLNDLYYDWNLNVDRYGMIHPEGSRKRVSGMKYVMMMGAPDADPHYVRGAVA